ncbi:hypothetical protein HJC23_009889, partial [Cyclotella cryptica]
RELLTKPSSTLPHLVARFQKHPQRSSLKSIEIWKTTCIVTNFGMQRHRNRRAASKHNDDNHQTLSHIPTCGPEPKNPPNRTAHHIMGYVSQWGGIDVGSTLFPAAVIDRLVRQLGGKCLKMEFSCLPKHSFSHAYHNQQTVPEEWSGIDSTVENLKSSDTARSARKREPVVAFGLLETSDAEVLATKLSESLQIHH